MLVENLDTWELALDTGVWIHIARRPWRRWEITREEERFNVLWDIRQMLWNKSVGWTDEYESSRAKLSKMLGSDAEVELIHELYSPPIPHEPVESHDEEFDTHRISIEDIIVRYIEGHAGIVMTVEGFLSDASINKLLEDIAGKLRRIEGKACKIQEIVG